MSAKHAYLVVLVVLNVLFCPIEALGQGDCEGVLVPDVTISNQDREVQLAWLKLATFDQFQQKGSSDKMSGRYGAVSASRDQKEFEQSKTSYLNRENFRYSETDVRSFFHRGLTPAQTDAWVRCKSGDQPGVYLLVTDLSSDTDATVRVLYRSAPGRTANVTIDTQGGTINQSARASLSMPHGSTRTFLIKKSAANQRMILVANAETPAGPENSSSAVFPVHYVEPGGSGGGDNGPVNPPSCSNPVQLTNLSASVPSVVDGNDGTLWNSGSQGDKEFTIALGGKTWIKRLEVLVEQGDSNPLSVRFYGTKVDGSAPELGTLAGGYTRAGYAVLTLGETTGADVVSLRVNLVGWRNWPAVREVKVFGCR